MSDEFCKQTARKIRKFGYVQRDAARYSRFLYTSMMSVCGIMAGLHRKNRVWSLCDETLRHIRCIAANRIVALQTITGTGIILSGPRAGEMGARSFSLHRH